MSVTYNWLDSLNVTQELLEKKKDTKRLPVIWISALDCTGCKESFIRSHEPTSLTTLLDFLSLEYCELLSVASGYQIEEHMESVFEQYKGEYVLCVEGSVPLNDEFLMIAGKSIKQEIIHAAKNAKAVIAVGSCSSWGGIPVAEPNPTNSVPITEIIPEGVPIALVTGCPPIAEVIVGTLLHVHFHGELPELDKKLRPKAFYGTTVHMACHRKPYFDQKLFAESFEEETGYCLFKVGCKGPTAFNACETIGWNGTGGSPIVANFPCIGCSEKGFWDKGGFTGKKK